MATPIPPNRARLSAWSAAAATDGTVVRARDEAPPAISIVSDSRALTPGGAFIAIRGAQRDGHDYLHDVAVRGASLLVVARGHGRAVPEGPDVVEVNDTLDAWGAIASAHLRDWRRARRDDPARVVAITGSAGKTTTKELCAALLAVVAPCHATAGNLNNRIGLPSVVFGLEAHHRFAVLEMGMSVRGEIAALVEVAPPDVSVITNIGLAHAEGVGGGRADVAHEKGALFAALSTAGVAVANADDAAVRGQVARSRAGRVETFGRADDATYRLVDRAPLAERGSRVVITRPSGAPIEVMLPLVGEAAALDLVAAIAAVEAASGWTLTSPMVEEGLAGVRAPEGRARIRDLPNGPLVLDDTYNANPASMRAALDTLRELAQARAARAVVVIGEMKELGAQSVDEHARLGDAIAHAGVALAIGCGGMASIALERASRAGVAVVDAPDVVAAAEEAVARVRSSDVVLVKGSRSVGAEVVVAALEEAGKRA
jgi:UDP-N-acetylmuramoyl-tripeptide--D-alanyl-D-alanine ligase